MPGKFNSYTINNRSAVQHDWAKIQRMPGGLTATDGITQTGIRRRARQSHGGTEFEEVIEFNCPSGLVLDFERWLLGETLPASVFAGGGITRDIPAQHPLKPWLYCVGVEMGTGYGALGNYAAVAQYPDGSPMKLNQAGNPLPAAGANPDPVKGAVMDYPTYVDATNGTDGYVPVVATYAALPFRVANDQSIGANTNDSPKVQGLQQAPEMRRWVERRFDLNVSRLPLDGQQMVFDDNNFLNDRWNRSVVPQTGAGVVVPIADIVWTWYAIPDLNWDEWSKHVGKVNDGLFDGLVGDPFGPHQAETLLFYAPKVRESRYRSVNGRPLWDVTFHCQKQIGYRGPSSGPGGPGGVQEGNVGYVRTWNTFPTPDGYFLEANFKNNPAQQAYTRSDWDKIFTLPNPIRNYD